MTQQEKERNSNILNIAYKFVNTIGIFGILISIGAAKEEIKSLSFDSSEDKINTKNHVNKALSPIQLNDLQQHITNPDFHMPKSAKDSVYILRKEHEDFVNRTSVAIWQTKEKLEEMNTLIKAIKKEVDKR
jgi:hypothetical protein